MIKMRRFKQELSNDENIEILKKNTCMVLAINGPYAIPLSYGYDDKYIYIHTAKEGYKIDLLKEDNHISFTIVDKDEIVPEKFTTYFRSIIGFGKAYIVEDDEEKRYALEVISEKYSKDYMNKFEDELKISFKNVCIIRIEIDELRGKEAIELKRMKEC